MIIIGSTALKYWYPDFPREPLDVDIVHHGLTDEQIWELKSHYSKQVECNNWGEFTPFGVLEYKHHLDPENLLTLKASHLCWNINWEKHLFDVQFLLKKGHKINSKLFWELYDHWNEVHGQNKRSDLKMTKEEFFDNAVNYDTGEHDEIHKILNPIPIYSRIHKDGSEVELDENKWNDLTFENKLEMIREEVMVMAFERWKHLDYRLAYGRMLKKFIISHAPKFTLIFIIENFIELHKAKYNFIKIIQDGIKKNK